LHFARHRLPSPCQSQPGCTGQHMLQGRRARNRHALPLSESSAHGPHPAGDFFSNPPSVRTSHTVSASLLTAPLVTKRPSPHAPSAVGGSRQARTADDLSPGGSIRRQCAHCSVHVILCRSADETVFSTYSCFLDGTTQRNWRQVQPPGMASPSTTAGYGRQVQPPGMASKYNRRVWLRFSTAACALINEPPTTRARLTPVGGGGQNPLLLRRWCLLSACWPLRGRSTATAARGRGMHRGSTV